MRDSRALRDAVIATAIEMNALGINRGKAGNVSARIDSGFLLTPERDALRRDRRRRHRRDGQRGSHASSRRPSSEWRFHRDIYAARNEAKAIVHTHSPFATTLACLDRGIPAFHYMIAVAGGPDIRCSPYATFGTQELSDRAVRALDGRRACLMSHHGMIALGPSLTHALALAVEVETLAEMYWRALQIGELALLPPDELDTVLTKFADYGKA